MNKEEINKIIDKYLNIDSKEDLEDAHTALNLAYEEGKNSRIENNTLTVEIPKGYKTLDTRELSEGDRHWIEVGLIEESEMCKIRQPHPGFDCPCNSEVKLDMKHMKNIKRDEFNQTAKALEELEDKPELLKQSGVNGSSGEWCHCGAWKQYGLPDNHHCTGYKITC